MVRVWSQKCLRPTPNEDDYRELPRTACSYKNICVNKKTDHVYSLNHPRVANGELIVLGVFTRTACTWGRKRPAAARGKAPTRNQNDAPDIPRFRDAKAAENYMKSLPRKVASTKFMCKSTLISLGVLEGVHQFFRNIGWENLLNLMAHTYKLPTREFLVDCGLDNEKKKFAFQLLGDRRYIDFAAINDILGLPYSNTSTVFDVLPVEFNHVTFWIEIIGGIFSCAGRDKATSIIHPCLRIAHRILVCTVFAHKEARKVTKMNSFSFTA
ncbi:unnamed protein product [Lactuca saligna]|uniref:Arabidopsis retrotransposon Orf1 C-terminal domain-containing protein n=1 Tax=Lactuca saligna TaxID=75948 RepID=A0AA35YKJ8_LACSI|nr:unnamed protein product [Lactuca saligna]